VVPYAESEGYTQGLCHQEVMNDDGVEAEEDDRHGARHKYKLGTERQKMHRFACVGIVSSDKGKGLRERWKEECAQTGDEVGRGG
jgi:hypothetical protein